MNYNSCLKKDLKMKLQNVVLGQIVTDTHGNEYEVIEIDYLCDVVPVKLKCIKHVKNVSVDCVFEFNKVGMSLWISESKESQYDFCPDVTLETLEPKEVNFDLYHEIEELKKRLDYLEKLISTTDEHK